MKRQYNKSLRHSGANRYIITKKNTQNAKRLPRFLCKIFHRIFLLISSIFTIFAIAFFSLSFTPPEHCNLAISWKSLKTHLRLRLKYWACTSVIFFYLQMHKQLGRNVGPFSSNVKKNVYKAFSTMMKKYDEP